MVASRSGRCLGPTRDQAARLGGAGLGTPRKTPAQRQWIVWADKSEQKRLRRLKALSRRGIVVLPGELITPGGAV